MSEPTSQMIDRDLLDNITTGKVVPMIGNSLDRAYLSDAAFDELIYRWANSTEIGYPWPSQATQTLIAEYLLMKTGETSARKEYLKFLKTEMLDRARRDCPANQAVPSAGISEIQVAKTSQKINLDTYSLTDLAYDLGFLAAGSNPSHPLVRLAALPFEVYFTTSFHRFLEVALFQANKQPESEIYPWDPRIPVKPATIFETDPEYEPSDARPLVYHLFGRDDFPESLVLSESDYLNWLTNHLSPQTIVGTQLSGIHPKVAQRLPLSLPLMLGYDLSEWDFKVLFHGLILKIRQNSSSKGVILQHLRQDTLDADHVKTYLENYLEDKTKLKIFWGSVDDCIDELENAMP
jgi:hypothetical protein